MRITRNVFWIVLFASTFFVGASVSQAGSGYEVKCKDAKCGFKAQAGIGGGMSFEEASGFCAKCQKWVAVTWKRGEKPPVPFAAFWEPQTGETRRLYKCPKCKQPFVVIEKIENMKFCPRCKGSTLENKGTMLYD
jgi:DNA-directed RNA polymerase subunit RPC12/RpoP